MGASAVAKWSWVVFLGGVLVYAPSLGHDFHYDDFHSIVNNPHIRSTGNLPAIFVDPTLFSVNPQSAMYRPLLLASYVVNYALDGLAPRGYHLLNLLLHALNGVLVFRLLLLLRQEGGLALCGALIFVLTPLNSEAVNYVSARSVLLLGTFFLGSCLAYVRFSRSGVRGWYVLGLVLVLAAVLVKSVAVVLGAVFLLCDLVLGGSQLVRRRWLAYIGVGLIAASYVLVVLPAIETAILVPVRRLDVQLWTQLKAQIYYGLLAAMPVKLSVEPQFFPSRSLLRWTVLLPGAVLSSLLLIAFWKPRRQVGAWLGWWTFILLPTTVVPLIVLVNEHRLYLPGLAFCWAMAWALEQWRRRQQRVAMAAIGAYTIILAVLAFEQTTVWKDETRLWRNAAVRGPQMFKPHLRLADALAADKEYAAAEISYRQALSLRPHHPGARNNLASMYMGQGRYQEARSALDKALGFDPSYIPARLNLAELKLRRGRWQEAETEYRDLLARDPKRGVAHLKLGRIALQYRKDPALAVDYFTHALPLLAAKAPVLAQRGVALKALGRLVAAERDYRESLQLDKHQIETWYNLGNLYQIQKRRAEAIGAFRRVLELGGDAWLETEAKARLQQLQPQAL